MNHIMIHSIVIVICIESDFEFFGTFSGIKRSDAERLKYRHSTLDIVDIRFFI